jgi:hypothetical protein
MSASGSDIFFSTRFALVQQDADVLGDVYDARIGGGFPPPAEPTCSGEGCQGAPSPLPSFPPAVSSTSPAAGNLLPPSITLAPLTEPKPNAKPKELTRAQKLAKALKACRGKGKPGKKRAACESLARKRYGGKANARQTHRGKSPHRRGK